MDANIEIRYEETKDKQMTLVCNEYYLHSKYAPLKEAQRLAEQYYKPHHLHVVFGFGNGFLIEELIKKCHFNEPILVIDPLIDKGLIPYKKIAYDRLYTVSMDSLEVVESMMDQLSSYTTNILLIQSINYNHIALDELEIIAKLVKEVQYKQVTNIKTSAWFAEQWQINYFMNLIQTSSDKSLNVLKKTTNAPIVIAAGGPSLVKQLPYVKKYRDKMILICAGSTINSLLKYNIDPDYVVSIDGGIANYNHFKDLKLTKSRLIYSPMMHYGIKKSFEKDAYIITPHVRPALQKHLKKQLNLDTPIIFGGGSVAHFSLSIAKYMTSGPIALIGQDLAFTNNQSHAEGNLGQENDKQGEMAIEGYNGTVVNSTAKFKVMINTFNEMQLLEPHENTVFNCTEGGARLKEYEEQPFSVFLENNCLDSIQIASDERAGNSASEFKITQEFESYKAILQNLTEGLEIVKKEKGPMFSTSFPTKLGKKEKQLNRLYELTCLDMLLEPTILFAENQFLPTINETKEEEFIRVKAYIIHLYSACKVSVENYIQKINELMEVK